MIASDRTYYVCLSRIPPAALWASRCERQRRTKETAP